MKKAKKYITVIVPCYQEMKFIDRCMNSIVNQTYGSDNYEIIVVDGMSSDGTRDIIKKYVDRYDNIRMYDNAKKIAPVAMNIGMDKSKGGYIARIDAHTEVPKNYLETCVEVMEETGAAVVGGPMETKGSGTWGRMISYVLSSVFGVGSSFRSVENYSGYVDTVAFGLYKRDVLVGAGPHDEVLIRGHDWEINQRIQKSGGRIYFDPRIRSTYFCANNPFKFINKSFKDGYWIAAIFEKHSFRHLVPFFFLLSIIVLGVACYWRRHQHGPWSYVFFPLWAYMLVYYLVAVIYSLGMVRISGWLAIVIGPFLYAAFHLSRGIGILYGLVTGVWLKPIRA